MSRVLWRQGDTVLAGRGFLAGFTVSVPKHRVSPSGLGRVKVGELLSPTSSCPPILFPEAGSASTEEVNRVGGAAPLPCRDFSLRQTHCWACSELVFPCPGLTWKLLSPESMLGAGASEWLKTCAVPNGAGQGECRSGGEPGAGARGWPAHAVFPRCWQRSAPIQLLQGWWEIGIEESRCL